MIALAANVHRVAEGEPAAFVLAFVVIRLLTTGLWVRAARATSGAERTFCRRYAAGFSLAIAIWLGSLLVPAPARYWVWALAMAVDLPTPAWAVSAVRGLVYDTAHIPERYGLFTIIVLGEAIFAVAAGTGDGEWRAVSALTASFCFVLAVCLWWAYFAYFGRMTIERGLPVWVWGYGHVFIHSGIAAAGVGSELAIEAALAGHGLDTPARWIFCSGAALFVLAFTVVQLATHVGVLRSTVVLRGLLVAWQIVLALAGGGLSAPLFAFLVVLPGFLLTAYVVARIGMPAPDASSPVEE